MAIVTQSQQAQSSSAVNGQATTYLKSLVLMQASAAPDSLVQSMINLTLIDFYGKSTAWREAVGPYTIAANIDEVQLNPIDAYSSLLYVLDAWLFPTNTDGHGKLQLKVTPRKIIGSETGGPTTYFMKRPDVMVLYPMPDANLGGKLYVQAVLRPSFNTTQLPPIATEQHLDGLLAGVLSRIFIIPNRPYSNRTEAVALDRKYRMERKMARDIANRGYGPSDTPFQFPPFDGGGSQTLTRGF